MRKETLKSVFWGELLWEECILVSTPLSLCLTVEISLLIVEVTLLRVEMSLCLIVEMLLLLGILTESFFNFSFDAAVESSKC